MIFDGNRALLEGFRRGDKSSLLAVYRHYVADVSAFLRRGFSFTSAGRTCRFRGFGGGYEIEAALQEVFRRAFEERARLAFDGISAYRPYLLRITQNLVINDLKSKQPILFRFRSGAPVVIDVGEPNEEVVSGDRSADEILEAREVASLVQQFKSSLNARELGVFSARFEEGLSAEGAAKSLGLTRSKVRTTEDLVRRRFLEHMQRSGYLESYRESHGARSVATLPNAIVALLSLGLGP
ncbi:MAG: sigma-70 family RNA polymerase sigma factor [Deltaproteobacteria bacterium]|nr:sigma-70 family RNA polymerase sigma factor [Deltaproteobacteria bacterium]